MSDAAVALTRWSTDDEIYLTVFSRGSPRQCIKVVGVLREIKDVKAMVPWRRKPGMAPITQVRTHGVRVKLVYEDRVEPRVFKPKREPSATSEEINDDWLVLALRCHDEIPIFARVADTDWERKLSVRLREGHWLHPLSIDRPNLELPTFQRQSLCRRGSHPKRKTDGQAQVCLQGAPEPHKPHNFRSIPHGCVAPESGWANLPCVFWLKYWIDSGIDGRITLRRNRPTCTTRHHLGQVQVHAAGTLAPEFQ